MMNFFPARFIAIIAALSLLVLYASPVYAGTTGSLSGIVRDGASMAPVAGASVTVAGTAQSGTTTTDAGGRFTFVSLSPDTYTLTVSKEKFQPRTIAGISIFADQVQSIVVQLQSSLKTIASVTTRSSLSPVKPGTTTDVYSVNPAVTQAAAPIGGGGNLDNAYSAIAAMPGAYVPPNQTGVNQTVYIRGGNYDQIGYEYDGVPMNRSFDNYPSHSASTLGQQELQIYTGGGPSSANATGLAGFINQVVKTGTYPGFGLASARVGTPAFHHELSVEAGGASPNRLFSYYVGLSGYNQEFRYLTNDNGAGLAGQFPQFWPSYVTTNLSFWPAVYPTCNNGNPKNFYNNPMLDNNPSIWADPGCFDYLGPNIDLPEGINGRETVANVHFGIPHKRDAGRDDVQLLYTNSTQIITAYNTPNDLQPMLSTLQNPNLAANNGEFPLQGDPTDPSTFYAYPAMWPDYYTFPSGTGFLQPANARVIAYGFPGSPGNRCYNTNWIAGQDSAAAAPITVPNQCAAGSYAPIPNTYRDGELFQASIVKLQYQKNIGTNAYLRAFGYTFYSNQSEGGAIGQGVTGTYGSLNLGGYRTSYDYEIGSHTRGGQLQFVDQINGAHQIAATMNYVTSTTLRYNNSNSYNVAGAPSNDWTGSGGYPVSNLTNGTQCFAAYDTGDVGDANGIDVYTAGQPAPCNDPITQGSFSDLTGNSDYGSAQNLNCSGGSNTRIPAGACAAGAAWRMTYLGNKADINQVTPKFANFSIADEWRPNDRLDVNASLRFDRDEFDLTPISNDPGKNFWFAAAQREFCYDPTTLQPALIPEPPQFLRDIQPYVSFNCPVNPANGVQTVHPDGKNGHILFTDQFNPTYIQNYFSPRLGLTYTVNPNTVVRFSAGRFQQEPQTYELEYNSAEPNLPTTLIGFLQFGFNTPFHPAQAQFSNNFDASLEHQFPGTDVGLKITPFYRYATNQLYSANVPTLNVSPGFNSGSESTYGAELQFTKGDFHKNGLSGIFSYTYTNSKEKWENFRNSTVNPVDPYNQDIQAFNALTKAGGGAPCYSTQARSDQNPNGALTSCAGTAIQGFDDWSVIANPYYTMSPQPQMDKFGWYDTGLDAPYISPNVFALILNYKHAKFAITPAITLNQGASYGTPADFHGMDPRTCRQNQGPTGANIPSALNPQTADYTSCKAAAVGASGSNPGYLYVPNPYTGKYDTFGQFRQPWQLNVGLQLHYDFSPQVSGSVIIANLLNRCFGGSSQPWTKVYAPSSSVCGYYSNRFYISNFYNGSSPNDLAANGVPLNQYFSAAFAPSYDGTDVASYNQPTPLQVYFQLQIKL